MKINVKDADYANVLKIKPEVHKLPVRQSAFFRLLLKSVSASDLKDTGFSCNVSVSELIKKNGPCLILMNHSSFIDLKIAATLIYPSPYNIICTSDAFIGKKELMFRLGCVPTEKFVTSTVLLHDIAYCLRTLKSSVLMYPEASYTFDGTSTPLPNSIGKCIKLLGVPVIMIKTNGAFLRDPLYNNLQNRHVKVSADASVIVTKEDTAVLTSDEINERLSKVFAFDGFREQREQKVKVSELFRADYLNRVLYKCPACKAEGKTTGKGTELICGACGKRYTLDEYGAIHAQSGITEFDHVPDWYKWERECVKLELENGTYKLDTDVDICVMRDMKSLYRVGKGHLTHDKSGFHLTGCGGLIDYFQKPLYSYSLYADYNWYELGDIICIGTKDMLYYCFPSVGGVVAKTRLAVEELYKLEKARVKKEK